MLPLVVVVSFWTPPAVAPAPGVDGVIVRRLIDGLKDPDLDVRHNLAAALARIGPSAVEPLTAALKDEVPERRAGAAYALGLIGAPARAALPTLLDLLSDDDVGVRRQASLAVARIVPPGPAAAGVASRSLTGGGKDR